MASLSKKSIVSNRKLLLFLMQDISDDYYIHDDYSVNCDIVKAVNKISSSIKNNDNHYLSLLNNDDNKLMVSFSNNENFKFIENKRIKTSFGKYIRRQLKFDTSLISDKLLSNIIDLINIKFSSTKIDFNKYLKIYVGDDILQKMWEFNGGQCESCMTKWKPNDLKNPLRLYKENPDKVGLLVHAENNKNIGRAFIWRADNKKFYIDRIYGNGIKIRAWSILKNIENVYDNDSNKIIITIKFNKKWGVGPYLDTFNIGKTINKNKITLNNYGDFENSDLYFTDSCGGFKYKVKCSCCGYESKYTFNNDDDDFVCINNKYFCTTSCSVYCCICNKNYRIYKKCKHLKKCKGCGGFFVFYKQYSYCSSYCSRYCSSLR